ncbi:hypothetical protein AMTRI_Chr08g168640 [Amborella trichopoda]
MSGTLKLISVDTCFPVNHRRKIAFSTKFPGLFGGNSVCCKRPGLVSVTCGLNSMEEGRNGGGFSGDFSVVLWGLRVLNSLHERRKTCRKAAELSGSGGGFAGEYTDMEMKPKKRTVAGIDQDELLDPSMLADPDSCFCEFKGVKIHHKVCDNEEVNNPSLSSNTLTFDSASSAGKPGCPMILLHGFGASVFSWDRVMRPLARVAGSKVLAFDRPAFGLTSRMEVGRSGDATPLNPYSMAFSVLATLSFIDILKTGKAILMGHSAGCLVAVNTYFEAPERIAALILVAPAILAPLLPQKVVRKDQVGEEIQMVDDGFPSNNQENLFSWIGKILSKLCSYVANTLMRLLRGMMDMVSGLFRNVLCAILRSRFALALVRIIIDKFGIAAVRNAWYDVNRVTDEVLRGYIKPLRTRSWDRALLEYMISMLMDSTSGSKPPLQKRLAEITCPVLIITGDSDRLVPAKNAKRLSIAIPGSQFEVIKNCGHLPHEERPEEFLCIVEKFLQRIFGIPEEQFIQAMA